MISLAIPRIRDFRGLSPKSFDGNGNYTFGVTEQLIFPEIEYDQIDLGFRSRLRNPSGNRSRKSELLTLAGEADAIPATFRKPDIQLILAVSDTCHETPLFQGKEDAKCGSNAETRLGGHFIESERISGFTKRLKHIAGARDRLANVALGGGAGRALVAATGASLLACRQGRVPPCRHARNIKYVWTRRPAARSPPWSWHGSR